MIGVAQFGEVKVKGRGRPSGKQRQGSRKFVELADGSIIKWWKNEWRFYSFRWNTKPATSLQLRAMSIADERGRMERVEERFTDFNTFAERLARVVGLDHLIQIVQWIQS